MLQIARAPPDLGSFGFAEMRFAGIHAMHVMRHDSERYTGRVLISSADRRWRGLMAELRSHSPGEIPPYIAAFTQVSILIRGPSIVTRKSGDIRQCIEGVPGTIGLSPMGVHEDFTHVSRPIDEMLHIYLSSTVFVALTKHTSRDFHPSTVRNHLNNYSILAVNPFRSSHASKGLDARRLQRTIDYIHANLTKEITVEELAAAASLSRFHFSRMFKIATGQSPSCFTGRLRLELSKSLLIAGKSIADVAHDCGFSSESNFVRSFRRSTGITPGQYRNRARNIN
jgi:AraC family transcriptional regulator